MALNEVYPFYINNKRYYELCKSTSMSVYSRTAPNSIQSTTNGGHITLSRRAHHKHAESLALFLFTNPSGCGCVHGQRRCRCVSAQALCICMRMWKIDLALPTTTQTAVYHFCCRCGLQPVAVNDASRSRMLFISLVSSSKCLSTRRAIKTATMFCFARETLLFCIRSLRNDGWFTSSVTD